MSTRIRAALYYVMFLITVVIVVSLFGSDLSRLAASVK